MKREKHISVALEAGVYDRLKALAVEDKRPVSNMARHIIKLYIKDIDEGKIQLSIYTRLKPPNPCDAQKKRG